ncbi:hypothetical protein [Bacillus testis]|uniref:hypothetical protein n=1 Tax=Bacillus testis TaxID=1622072 RepID=UPI000A9ABDBF|nr:hypothetical protein [Bacillus testis]
MPASEQGIIDAATLYYLAYGEDLPVWDYSQEDIQYIIEQCNQKIIQPDIDNLRSDIVH